jgi:predicted acylesterase/phospholipase RssA
MSYDIEIMSIGEDHYDLLEKSAARLNSIQNQFKFSTTSKNQRLDAIEFSHREYKTDQIWDFLKKHKERFGGRRPYLIAFINAPLSSSRMSNLFASRTDNGLVVVTLQDTGLYVKEKSRYCSYYMVRYAMSFVNQSLSSHDDTERANCYFHKKIAKQEIRLSMDSGDLCDICRDRLLNPQKEDKATALSSEERSALETMRLFVKGEYPNSIILKGGGVKGLAFTGALLELEKYFWFDQHVGTSAGAIAAALLAAKYTPEELRDVLLKKDFRDFMDAPIWKILFNLLVYKGLFPGEAFRLWMDELLKKKIDMMGEIPMEKLKTAIIYASRRGTGTVRFNSQGDRSDSGAAFAVRCSMSIPVFFYPQMIDGRRVYDGGLRNNFPLTRYLADGGKRPFIGLYLGRRDDGRQGWFGKDFLDIVIDGEEYQTVDYYREDIVIIDTSPIGTVDFDMSLKEKEFLLAIGKSSALKFLLARNLDDGPTEEELDEAVRAVDQLREDIFPIRKVRRDRSRQKKWLTAIVLVALCIAAYLVRRFL